MRPPLWSLLAIPVLAALGWFLLTTERGPAPVSEAPQDEVTDLSCTIVGGDCVHTEETPHYSISVTYPNVTGNKKMVIEQHLMAQVEQFKDDLDNMLDDAEKARLEAAERKYEYIVEYKPFSGSGYESYQFDIYIDTGGAHPNGFYKTLVFDTEDLKVELQDLFKPDARYLDAVSERAYSQVLAQLRERTGAEISLDMEDTVRIGTSPSPEALQHFVIDGDDLIILFPPYQVAAYAAGSFEARIPLRSLQDILK